MLTDVAILLGLGFAAGYGLRAWISTGGGAPLGRLVEIEHSAVGIKCR